MHQKLVTNGEQLHCTNTNMLVIAKADWENYLQGAIILSQYHADLTRNQILAPDPAFLDRKLEVCVQ